MRQPLCRRASTSGGRATARSALLILVAAALAASLPAGSALAIFTQQTTATANTVSTAAAFPRCYDDAVLADNPASLWRLDETSGTTAADSKGSNPGTYRNGVTLGQTGALPDTINNKAASFDAVDDDVQVGDVYDYAGTASFSIEFWMNRTTTNDTLWRPLIAKEDPGADWSSRQGWAMWLAPNTNTISMERWNGTTQAGTSSLTPIQASRWYHIVATYDGSTIRLYVNGTLDSSVATSLSLNDHTIPLRFGSFGSSTGSGWFSRYAGLLDEVAIYSTTLSAAQVRTHYNTGLCYKDSVLADGPVGYWRLGESSGSTAVEGTHGYQGTYFNTPTLGQTGALNLDANTSVTFNGTNNRVVAPYTSSLNPAQVTVEAWAKPTAGSGTNRGIADSFYDDGAGTVRGFFLGIDTSNRWWLALGNGTAYKGATGSTATLNTWTHVVGTFDGTTARLYVNGVLAGSAAASYAANTVQPVTMGAWPYLGSWVDQFTGSVDEVAVYGSALSQARIQAHYLLGRSYKDTILDSTAAVSYWRLGEGSGTSAADAKGSNTGTYANSPSLGQAGALAGDSDSSVGFNSTNQNVSVPDSASLRPSQISVEAWVKPDSTTIGDFDSPVMKTSNDNWTDGYGLFYRSSGTTMDFYVNSWGLAVAATIGLDQWTHVVGTYDGATVSLYLNGALAASASYSTAITHATNALYLGSGATGSGAAGPPGYFWGGRIDDVAIYNRALTATEVQLHYDSGRQ